MLFFFIAFNSPTHTVDVFKFLMRFMGVWFLHVLSESGDLRFCPQRNFVGVWGTWEVFKDYPVFIKQKKKNLCAHPRPKVSLVSSVGWTPPILLLVSNPMSGIHGQDLKSFWFGNLRV